MAAVCARRSLSRIASSAGSCLVSLCLTLGIACGDGGRSQHSTAPAEARDGVAGSDTGLLRGDLAEIRRRGTLRILMLRGNRGYLPRSGSPLDHERKLAQALAEDLGLKSEFVPVDSLEELIPGLLEGRGDLVADNFTVTQERQQRVAFSSPVTTVREQVVTRADDESLQRPEDLRDAGRRIAVRRSSSLWESVEKLRARIPGIQVEVAPESLETDELLEGVARGDFDLTVADSNLVRAALAWRDDIRVAFDLDRPRMIAWAMRPDGVELRKATDAFLSKHQLGADAPRRYAEDLPGIQKRGVLRVLTRNSGTTYFIWRGELLGFEYDLARRFAERHGLRLEMVVPPSREDLLPWLLDGRGDIAAAALSASPERAEREGVAFSRNYLGALETVVARAGDTDLEEPADLAGRTLVVRRSSSYWHTLEKLQREGIELRLVAAPEELETEQIIDRVAEGEYDLTLADSHILDVALTWRDDIRSAFALGERVAHGWALRPGDGQLMAAVNGFFDAEYRGLFYNVTLKKYFKNPRKVRKFVEFRSDEEQISPYDDEARLYAGRYGFDWRLIVAQMHQESRFDPQARSFAGAQGLLQVLPRTAREMGFKSLSNSEAGVHAGVKYLAWLRDRFPPELPAAERNWLALASYNVGFGHVRDARRLAAERGWDRDRWFGNVEQAMLLKEQPEVFRHTRFGYARGSEPVRYVRAILDRYQAYVRIARPLAAR
jgi:membrane-bound lytic murein transglycosylase F